MPTERMVMHTSGALSAQDRTLLGVDSIITMQGGVSFDSTLTTATN